MRGSPLVAVSCLLLVATAGLGVAVSGSAGNAELAAGPAATDGQFDTGVTQSAFEFGGGGSDGGDGSGNGGDAPGRVTGESVRSVGTTGSEGESASVPDADGDGLADPTENGTGTDPHTADTDGDGLVDGREREVGLDPLGVDTDGDGVADGREVERGTSPLGVDADGDGLADERELELGTDVFTADTDGDGLTDGRERELGTDPTGPDTDGDRLLDGWEVTGATEEGVLLPESDPLAKDLYVQIDYASGVRSRDDGFYAALAAEFAGMPVDNPGGETGIDLHVREGGRLNRSVTVTEDNFWELKDQFYRERLGQRAGIYHQVVVGEFAAGTVGYGEVGGRFSAVAAGVENRTQRRATVHELLHNVVGRVHAPGACRADPKHYCEGGYLSPELVAGEDAYLADGLARQLERRGFASRGDRQ